MTNRVKLHDAIAHLKQLQKKKIKGNGGGANGEDPFLVIEASKFKTVGGKTMTRQDLATALEIRFFQRVTRMGRCDMELLTKEIGKNDATLSYSGAGVPEKSIGKPNLEEILHRLLSFLKPETFQGSMKAINELILSVLDQTGSGWVDLGMFYAVIAPICGGTAEKRKQAAFDALLWRSVNEGASVTQVRKADAAMYIKLLRAIYIPSGGTSELLEVHGETDASAVSLSEFLVMFHDPERGFDVSSTLIKLENRDRNRHDRHICSVCRYPVIGSRFKETKSNFILCNQCYSERKVPVTSKQEGYRFKENGSEAEAMKDKCVCFNLLSHNES